MLRNGCRFLLVASLLLWSGLAAAQTSFVEFESGHVRPINGFVGTETRPPQSR